MCDTIRPASVSDGEGAFVERLQLKVLPFVGGILVLPTGELDWVGRDELVYVSTAGNHRDVFIDLSCVTFMDCAGYGGLVASRLRLESDGRKLTVLNSTGQPKRFLAMIEALGLQGHRHNEVRGQDVAVDAS